ncbi:MAG TPA: SurA N-terminal domain-containing protein [Acetobacteraceae bacterium]|nr:SurA N-terminal domain-containing protein [Acetobacteraceae bacterium]
MITAFRRYLETKAMRALFLLLAIAFVLWGVGDVVRMVGSPTWVAKVGNQIIDGPVFQAEYQRALNQATAKLPPNQDASASLRRSVGDETLQRLIQQAALQQEINRLRVVVPDSAVRQAILELPAFHDKQGQFSRQLFETALQNNGLTEQRFVQLLRDELAERQVVTAVASGAGAPQVEALPLFQEQFEQRSADMVEFPFDAESAPTPTPDELQRWYANHPFDYSSPEMRRIKAIILSPQTLEKEIPITNQELQDAYAQRKSEFVTPAKRSAQVVTTPDEAKAQALAAQWKGGANWAAMQAAAQKDGGSAVAMDNATQPEFPDAALAKAVFAATKDAVSAPVKGALGWYVVKVTQATPGSEKTFDQVKDELRSRLLAEKATDLMYDRANKIDNLLGNGTPFDQLPGDLGLVGVEGTMDAQGNTAAGTPAPIPGPPALHDAIVAAAFRLQKGELPQLTEVQTPSAGGSAYYALTVDDIIPPAVKPYDAVKQQVDADWIAHQKRRAAEVKAAKMLMALKGGQALADAAAVAGVPVTHTPLANRETAPQEMPPALADVLFSLKPREPTMVATQSMFIVAEPAKIDIPQVAHDPGGFQQLRGALNASIGNDMATVFIQALRDRANPRINKENYDSIVQP